MATPLVAGDVIRVVYATRVTAKAQLGLFRCFYRVVAPGSATYETLADDIFQNIRTVLTAWLSTSATFQGVSVTREKKNMAGVTVGKFGPVIFRTTATGTEATALLPLQASAMIRSVCAALPLNTPPLGSGKGRCYIPWVSLGEYDSTTAKLNAAGLAKLWNVASKIGPSVLLGGKGANLAMVIRRTAYAEPPAVRPFAGWSDVTSLEAQNLIATQRRRGDFGKINAAF